MCDISMDLSRAMSLDSEGHAYLWFLDVQSTFDVLRQQSDTICCVQHFPSNKHIAVGYADGLVKVGEPHGVLASLSCF